MQKRRQRSLLMYGGQNWFNSLPHYRFSARMIFKKRINNGGMDASEIRMIFQFIPQQITTLPKWMLVQKLFFNLSLLVWHSSTSSSSYDLCFLFCINPSSMASCSALRVPYIKTLLLKHPGHPNSRVIFVKQKCPRMILSTKIFSPVLH